MDQELIISEKVSSLKKAISVLEWDIPNIKNNKLRQAKEKKLELLKVELNNLRVN